MAPTRIHATSSMSFEARHVNLDFTSQDSAMQAHEALQNLPFSTTSISLKGYGSLLNISKLDEALEHLLLPLEELHFDMTIPIPTSTLSVIEIYHTHTRLYYHMSFSHWDPYDRSVPSIQISGVEPSHSYRHQMRHGIIGSKNLYTLKASILYGGRNNHEDLPLVYGILKSCPNIRELDLSIEHSGCVVASYPHAFDFTRDATQLPPLENLKLSRYRLDHYKNGDQVSSLDLTPFPWLNGIVKTLNPWVDWSYWVGTRPSEPLNLDGWIEHMDWSKLKYLELDSVDEAILERLGSVATGLESFTAHDADSDTSLYIPTFLKNLDKPLKHLELRNFGFDDYGDLITAIGTNHQTLRSLRLTEVEDNRRPFCSRRSPDKFYPEADEIFCLARPYLDESLLSLAEHNKEISHLTIDVPRIIPNLTDTSTWTLDYATVKAASLQPSLTHLSLRMESPEHVLVRNNRKPTYMYKLMGEGVELPSFFDDPSFNRTSVPRLVESMNKWRREASLPPLKELEIRVSRFDLKDNDDWGMMPPPNLLVGRWVCRDEGSGSEKCFGGSDRLGFYSGEERCQIQEPYSEDWALPDRRASSCGTEENREWNHDEL